MEFKVTVSDERIEAAITAEVRSRLGAFWRNEEFIRKVAAAMVDTLADAGGQKDCEGVAYHDRTADTDREIARVRRVRRFRSDIIAAISDTATSAGWLRKAAKSAVMAASAETLRGHASAITSAVMRNIGIAADSATGGTID